MSNDIKICTLKLLPEDVQKEAYEKAVMENPANDMKEEMGASPEKNEMALMKFKKWQPGRKLRVRFLDGVSDVQEKVEKYAHQWEKYANIKFIFGNDRDAEIRISFNEKGSWSYLGTDCLSIPKDQPTMNYGWLRSDTPENEYSRVVLHEFGHALGCIHEHQNPTTNIPWDKEAVYRYYAGPPNNWTKEQVDQNLFKHYSRTITNFSTFDKKSIMLYAIPNSLTLGDYEVGWNSTLSDRDKQFIKEMYPGSEVRVIHEASIQNERAAQQNDPLQ
ncbi:MAG: M12 family metallopeptidase [Bacillota bacterium]